MALVLRQIPAPTNDSITFEAPTSGTGYYPASSQIIALIGINSGGVNQIVNPASAGAYEIRVTLINTAPGGGEQASVFTPIVDSDEVDIYGFVKSRINFDIDTAVTDSDCDYNTCLAHENGSAAGNYTVDFGEMDPTWVNASNSAAYLHSDTLSGKANSIWLDLSTNASQGAVVYVTSTNAALVGSVSGTIPSVTETQNIVAGTPAYGFNLPVAGTAIEGTVIRNSNCDDATSYCSFTTTPKVVFNTNNFVIDHARVRMDLAATISNATVPGNYSDTLTFFVTPTF